jgi:hypothetical protein
MNEILIEEIEKVEVVYSIMLSYWEPVLHKIRTLKDKGISLTDHIAIAAQQKADKRAQLVENMRNAKTAKAAEKSKDASKTETEPSDQVPEPTDEENTDS